MRYDVNSPNISSQQQQLLLEQQSSSTMDYNNGKIKTHNNSFTFFNDDGDNQHHHHHQDNSENIISLVEDESYESTSLLSSSSPNHNKQPKKYKPSTTIDNSIEPSSSSFNHQDIDDSVQEKGYWRSRLNVGLVSIIFLEFILVFSYIPYLYYYIDLAIHSSTVSSRFACFVILALYHFIYIIAHCCLYKTTFTDPGTPPSNFFDVINSKTNSFSQYNNNNSLNLVNETKSQGEKRYCNKCNKYKPDRAHHCSKCKRCILKMDHHCPFVNNCVGYFNYKFFVLFLIWASVLCYFVLGTTLTNFGRLLDKGDANVFVGVVFIVALIFGLGLTAFTGTHLSYIVRNETTIEHMEKKSRIRRVIGQTMPYSKGTYYNICQVFGNQPLFWFIPVSPSHDRTSGLIFPINFDDSENNV